LDLRVRECDCHAVSDPVLLHQIVANLLGNGLRYTVSGGILLACRRRGTMIRLEVWDTGVGIPPDRLDEIFEEFHRIASVEDSGFRGVGLGLSIVRRTASLLNHKVIVCSRLGRGSMFSITLPRSVPGEERRNEPLPAASAHSVTGGDPS
jgi:signal transduction histidine kinase